jgi:hypothetical protein
MFYDPNVETEGVVDRDEYYDEEPASHVKIGDQPAEVVRRMPKRRWREPILAAVTLTGLFIIDGNHRLARLIMDGNSYVSAWILQPQVLDRIRVHWFAENVAGAMEEISHQELTRRFLQHPTM